MNLGVLEKGEKTIGFEYQEKCKFLHFEYKNKCFIFSQNLIKILTYEAF